MSGGPAVLQQDLERPAREVLPQVPGSPGHQSQAGQLSSSPHEPTYPHISPLKILVGSHEDILVGSHEDIISGLT